MKVSPIISANIPRKVFSIVVQYIVFLYSELFWLLSFSQVKAKGCKKPPTNDIVSYIIAYALLNTLQFKKQNFVSPSQKLLYGPHPNLSPSPL